MQALATKIAIKLKISKKNSLGNETKLKMETFLSRLVDAISGIAFNALASSQKTDPGLQLK